jgi:hypothetical protein
MSPTYRYPHITHTSATPSSNRNTSKIRDTVSPQEEYDMKPDYQTVRSAAKVHRKKKTAPKRV